MSYRKFVTLYCDEEDCLTAIDTSCPRVRGAREEAANQGWETGPDGDYCPDDAGGNS